jgi:hypothetical protein
MIRPRAFALRTGGCALAVALVLAAPIVGAAPPTASAEDIAAANVELTEGLAAYERKDFAVAQGHFERAHGLHPTPESLYAWAQAARGAGDCETAVVLYRRFIDEGATGDPREAARQNETRCREILAARTVPVPVVEPPSASPPQASSAPVVDATRAEPPPRDRPRRRDAAGIALVSTGAVAVVAGAVSIAVAESLRARQSSTRDYDRFDALDGRIDALHIAGGLTLGVGAVLAVVGGVRLGLARRRDRIVWLAPRFGRTTGMLVLGVTPMR